MPGAELRVIADLEIQPPLVILYMHLRLESECSTPDVSYTGRGAGAFFCTNEEVSRDHVVGEVERETCGDSGYSIFWDIFFFAM